MLRKRSFAVLMLVVWLGAGLAGCTRKPPAAPPSLPPVRILTTSVPPTPTVADLKKARAGFRTKLIPSRYQSDGPLAPLSDGSYRVVHYSSPAGKLAAYLSPDPGDGRRHPALVWAHGDFGGTYPAPDVFRAAGLVVLCPAWRAENGKDRK